MLLVRTGETLDINQPRKQHGFRKGRRIEEHMLTANVIIDRTFACNRPIWIISLNLSKAFDSKAFDCVDWDALWAALKHNDISQHSCLILQGLYHDKVGQVHDGLKP